MKRKWIAIALTLLAILLLLGALLLLGPTKEPAGNVLPAAHFILGGPDPKEVRSIAVVNRRGQFSLTLGAAGMSIDGFEEFPADALALNKITELCSRLTAKSQVATSSLAPYGLDDPAASVTISYADTSSATLFIGDAAPGGAGYYATADRHTVYLIGGDGIANFFATPLQLLNKTVTEGSSQETAFTAMRLGGLVREKPIEIERFQSRTEASRFVLHVITSPVKANLDIAQMEALLSPVFGLAAGEIAAIASDDVTLAEYGLADPYSTIEVTTDVIGTFILRASRPAENGMVYLMRDSVKLIYAVPQGALPWLNAQVFDLMSRLALTPAIDTVSNITVTTPEAAYDFALSGEGKSLKVASGGQTLETAGFRKFYQTLLSARYDAMPDTPPDLAGAEVLLAFRYAYRSGAPEDHLVFYKGPPLYAYIVCNDGTPYLTPLSYIEKVAMDLNSLPEGEY